MEIIMYPSSTTHGSCCDPSYFSVGLLGPSASYKAIHTGIIIGRSFLSLNSFRRFD